MADHSEQSCRRADAGVARVFEVFGKRWTGLIVATLLPGPVHFAELRRAVEGISERMLSDRLTELSATGLVVREVDAGPPLRVTYRLTEAGQALEPALAELGKWAERYLSDGGTCPERFRK
ncbi:helix-turn-helix domain-containing protein [Streptomyces sp. MST-110588]|uniref:winged helix-turn-helix transcriptional regulator n=1 Tax=Streptomyces sp. MST-110588 TaxID=2833628 RepID=UPI001F5DAFA3|nr:helix-turn-helix domain-containing protein [Streptomyces sp. MST-110588]UNO40995.1 helix-turn-helix transcriptional regulator [Streptomyces sp. MST-110588]